VGQVQGARLLSESAKSQVVNVIGHDQH